MAVAGTSEAATRALPLLFALLAVPVSYWAGSAAFGRRAGALAAAGAAGCPFLTYYAQETRMYSMVAVLSVLASASFVLAFVHGRRRHVWLLGLWLVLLLYAHNWALFLVAGMGAAWLWLWHEGRVEAATARCWRPAWRSRTRRGCRACSSRPATRRRRGRRGRRRSRCSPSPGVLFGCVAVPLLVLGAGAALQRARPSEGTRLLALIGGVAALLAFLGSQLEPAWAPRYLAILFGPLLLALAAVLARGARWTWLPLLGVVVIWLASAPAPVKSNVRTAASTVMPELRPGDLVVCTQPEQVPVLARYLPPGLRYVTPLGSGRRAAGDRLA